MVNIDLTTLQGWNDLPDGTYDITVGAKAAGYTRIKQSSAVSVVKETPYFLTFSSPNSFTINVAENIKSWDGTLEYSADKENWNEWDGTTVLNSGLNNELYLRGIGNTTFTTFGANFVLNGTDISCNGNIETLLDYQTVANGQHPTMGDFCYSSMFSNCASLIRAPELPATTLTTSCYNSMFQGCTSLAQAPELPAAILTNRCYRRMFGGCTSLTTTPSLPATTLEESCYQQMFEGCTSLTTAPELLVKTLVKSCYMEMFSGCTNLTTAPELPATTLAENCYREMFYNCTSLTTAPELPAITLAKQCYRGMFSNCTSLYVSDTQTLESQYEWRIPTNNVITETVPSQFYMFMHCLGTRSSDDFAGQAGQQYIYYTQNPPVGSN